MADRTFDVLENTLISLPDGRQLAARIWMPERQSEETLPAVLEYLPYRKRDGTAPRDESTYPTFAAAGIVGVRVDVSGNGESDGVFDDEYSEDELSMGVHVINWIADQPWCSGSVGMMGISWGGFNALQIAAMKPPALKAVISLSSSVDRYNDDIHYKNGCHLYSNFYWANVMMCYASRPPDPALRNNWHQLWEQRLDSMPWLFNPWMEHQRRDDYWKHGSICENYDEYDVPTLIMGGWADLYINAPPAALANAAGPIKAVNGPWIHKYPHFAWPKPRMDFLGEAIAWWKRYLNDEANDVDKLPAYRAYINEASRPGGRREVEQGRWVMENEWPSPNISWTDHQLNHDGSLQPVSSNHSADSSDMLLCSPLDCGTASGEVFSLNPGCDLAADQRVDDAGSLVFDSDVINEAFDILGRPKLTCELSVDQTVGNLIVRLVDVHPDGCGYRVSWGALNLCHRNGNEHPEAVPAGQKITVSIDLNECGYRFMPGHRVRVALSTSYWPMIMPPPALMSAQISVDGATTITLPVRVSGEDVEVPQPLNENPLPDYQSHSESVQKRWVERDFSLNESRMHIVDDSGDDEMPEHGLRVRHLREECWTIGWDDPLTSRAEGKHTWWSSRGDWKIRTECTTEFWCDGDYFYSTARLEAFEGEELIKQREWQTRHARDHM